LIEVSGTLYGTTISGGAHSYGTAFSITTTGDEHVLHSFSGAPDDGADPVASLIDVNGMLYGTTIGGGTYYDTYGGDGTVFALSP
jgi:uncharacterized repeat protein (TIGR03803 family)